ncbi:alpha/beta hydrolase fold-domain-containing protein [Coniella lustricola]|uniref:Alpha/beta hydrolase fold-domain-containing protein n=1 Tax=Coniella lustricola TaxID=2025994 RepID=A0A2T3A903_9PEZI|nr:alpha/beta hydrolase fold-domain-containing protein [Coniella lustricola]
MRDESGPQPPYPLRPEVLHRLAADYAEFYNENLVDKQQVHLQPVEASRSSGILISGAGPKYTVGKTEDVSIPRTASSGPDVSLRLFTPGGKRPVHGWPCLFYYHGGGWVLGDINTENVIATNLCGRAKCVVVNVDYRLAPEDPFPAAVDDAWEAVLWAVRGPGKEVLDIDTTKLATGGSSAGANLAAIMCQRAADRPELAISFVSQLLSVPVADNTASPETKASWKENEHVPALPPPKMMWYRRHYLPNETDWAHPEASPLLWTGDWTKLPSAEVVLGELDPLRTEGEEIAEKLIKAGKTDTRVTTMKGQPHPFIAMDGILDCGKLAITLFVERLLRAFYVDN